MDKVSQTYAIDPRFVQDRGPQIFNGVELILKGALEARVSLITGYPGSPVAGLFDVITAVKELLMANGIEAGMANNEAISAAMLNGSQMEDIRALAVMKSIGLHVASDGLALGNLSKTGRQGGAVVVVGDDSWTDSTQVPADSRFAFRHLQIPVVEPSTFQEAKDFIPLALDLSRDSDLYVGYIITTPQADGGGTVETGPNRYPSISRLKRVTLSTQRIPTQETVLLPPRTERREQDLVERFDRILQTARRHGINRLIPGTGPQAEKIGFVASGISYLYLQHAFSELGLSGRFPILKVGMSYPLDPEPIMHLAARVRMIVVVEEKRPFLEEAVKILLQDAVLKGALTEAPPVWGKSFAGGRPGFPVAGGLNPSILMERVMDLLERHELAVDRRENFREIREVLSETEQESTLLPERTPTFCPGCPHRDSSSVLLEVKKSFMDADYMKRQHHSKPVDLVFHGDTGCYTMMMFEPNSDLMHNYSGMGLGGATGAGIDPFITNKQLVFMGDGTFFHSGSVAISNSIKNHQDITYIVLENKTTAMTGHQPTAGTDTDLLGRPTAIQDIERIIRAMCPSGEQRVYRVNPEYRQTYRELLERTILEPGVKVVIADKECGITYQRRVKRQRKQQIKSLGYLPEERRINVTQDVCEFCLACTEKTGCPGLTFTDTLYGTKVQTDLSTCESDGACYRIEACPSFEEIAIQRRRAPQPRLPETWLARPLPDPPVRPIERHWHAYITGVGGMGIGVLTAVLVRAGFRQGYRVQFSDKKGLAIRNGGVYSQIIFSKDDAEISPVIPYGRADILLGMDILEAARAVDPGSHVRVASRRYTSAVINTAKTPTIATLVGKSDFDPRELEKWLQQRTRWQDYVGMDLFELSERLLGHKLYANLMLLGTAYQKGYLPLEQDHLIWAIRETIRPDELDENLKAFQLGRWVAESPQAISPMETLKDDRRVMEEKARVLRRDWLGSVRERRYRRILAQAFDRMPHLSADGRRDLALRVYDLIHYEGFGLAERYLTRIEAVYQKDRDTYQYAATYAAILYAFKVIAIKDEVYVAHLLTSPEKLERDRERYQVDERRGDRVKYVHFNRPSFTVFGRDFEFSIRTYNWQLGIVKQMKFLRWLLPQWHRREKEFRDWYLDLVDTFQYDGQASYRAYTEALRVPEMVRGYREYRYPKMEEARRQADRLIRMARRLATDSSASVVASA